MNYIFSSAIVLSLLFIPFQLLLRKEKYFALNRAILVGIMLVSLILPAVDHTSPFSLDALFSLKEDSTQQFDVEIESLTIATIEETEIQEPSWIEQNWQLLLFYVWLLGTLIFAVWQLIGMVRLYRLMHSKDMIKQKLDNGNTLNITTRSIPSFSFMRSIVISAQDYAENSDSIITHECAHIAHCHSIDRILLLVCQTIQWFNPFVWMLDDALSQVHEYAADYAVLRSGINATQYQLLLIRKAAGPAGLLLINGFKRNKLKLRIVMMNNMINLRGAKCRYLVLLPMLAIAFVVTASVKPSPVSDEPTVQAAEVGSDDLTFLVNQKGQVIMTAKGQQPQYIDNKDLSKEIKALNLSADTQVIINADAGVKMQIITDLKNALRENSIQKISFKTYEAVKSVNANFALSTESLAPEKKPLVIVEGKVVEDINSIDPNTISSIEVFKNPDAKVAEYFEKYPEKTKNGVLYITLRKDGEQGKKIKYSEPAKVAGNGIKVLEDRFGKDGDEVISVCEEQPLFPGGEKAMMEFVRDNLRYPESCVKDSIQGRVTLSFVVNKDGSVSDVKEMRSPNVELTNEAIRVVSSMPNWTPGKQGGKPVNVMYVMPISFRLK